MFFYRKVEVDKNKKLLNFAYVILFTSIFYLLIELIKTPVGRMRYRAMNELGDFSYFTPWYQISDAKTLLKDTYTLKDAFKSFPSGHTFSAGISYVLICIPYVFEKFNTKKWKVIFYLIPICYTGLVATFRIVVGAHYLSDVLFGGTIAYVASEVFKYVFILRKKNL